MHHRPAPPRPRRTALPTVPAGGLALLAVTAVLLAGCSDQALVDRVAQLETAQDRLRDSLTDLGAPDPEALAVQDQLASEIATVATQAADLDALLSGIRADLDTQVLELDDRLTSAELDGDDLATRLAQLEAALTALTDRVTSLEVQLDVHRDDPSGHGG